MERIKGCGEIVRSSRHGRIPEAGVIDQSFPQMPDTHGVSLHGGVPPYELRTESVEGCATRDRKRLSHYKAGLARIRACASAFLAAFLLPQFHGCRSIPEGDAPTGSIVEETVLRATVAASGTEALDRMTIALITECPSLRDGRPFLLVAPVLPPDSGERSAAAMAVLLVERLRSMRLLRDDVPPERISRLYSERVATSDPDVLYWRIKVMSPGSEDMPWQSEVPILKTVLDNMNTNQEATP